MAHQSPKNDRMAQTPAKLADYRQIDRSELSGHFFGLTSNWRGRCNASPSGFRLGLTCFAIASAAVFDGSLIRLARADEPLTECRIHIGLSSYAPQNCVLGGDAINLRITWPHSAARTYWVNLKVSPEGTTAEASWNDLGADLEEGKPLGTLNRADECWESDTVSICFVPKDEAQRSPELYGQETQPLDDRLAALGKGQSVTCVATEEDLYSPSARAMNWARAGESTKLNLKTPRQWQFQRMQGSVSVNGNAVAPKGVSGDIVAVSIVDVVGSFEDPRVQYLSPKEKEEWAQLQQFLRGLQPQLAAASGLQDRLFVIDFANGGASLATDAGSQLDEVQQMNCY